MSLLDEINGSGNTDVHSFITSLECSAKRIMRDANRKAKKAARDAEVFENKSKRKDLINNPSKMNMTKVLMTSKSIPNELDSTVVMNYSVPKMMVSMGNGTASDTLNMFGNDDANKPLGLGTTQQLSLSPIKSRPLSSGKLDTTTKLHPLPASKVNQTLKKLNSSPFLPSSTLESLEEILARSKNKDKALGDSVAATASKNETTWALKLHAATVMAGKTPLSNVNKMFTKLMDQKGKKKGGTIEAQGPIDWSCYGLKIKYRGESSREGAYQSWLAANAYSQQVFNDTEAVLPVAKMERHPLFVNYDAFIAEENNKALSRTKTRLLMKRFVMDVHEVWLSNLQHLREHQPSMVIENISSDEMESYCRANGLEGRRDVKAVEGMQSQIASCSQKRAVEKAYYTSRLPDPKVVLDYLPRKTPRMWPPPIIPPTLEVMANGIVIDITPSSLRKSNRRLLSCNEIDVNQVQLYINRLVPSHDPLKEFPDIVVEDVWWRFSIYRSYDSRIKEYIAPESMIATLAAQTLTTNNKTPSFPPAVVYHCNKVSIPWGEFDLNGTLTLTLTAYKRNAMNNQSNDDFSINFECKVILDEEYHHQHLVVCNSSIEMKYLLDIEMGINAGNLEYWLDNERTLDLYPQLLSKLYVEQGDLDENENPVPINLSYSYKKTAADRIDGALSSSQALMATAELIPKVRVDQHLNLTLEGSPSDMFYPPRFRYVTDGGLEFKEDHDKEMLDPLMQVVLNQWWEELADRVPNLSMQTSGALEKVGLCPGACEYGRIGLWFPHRMTREYTQVSATFYRDPLQSTTDTVYVNFTLALDTSLQFHTALAWEDFPTFPDKAPNEEVDGVVPMIIPRVDTLLQERIINSRESRLSCECMIFNTAPIEGTDHIPKDISLRPAGFVRHWPFRNEYGFRRKLLENLLVTDPVLNTLAFGLTTKATQPNVPGVNTRNIWHSTVAITEHINRPRVAKDYAYIINKLTTCGPNEAASFAARLKYLEFIGLSSSVLNQFEANYKEIQERRDAFSKQLALENKIEASEMKLKAKEKEIKTRISKELQRAIEKKVRKATKSEKGWARRFMMSSILEVQGNWERRKDDRSGMVFFRKIHNPADGKEKFLNTCQWQVPATWDGDPLALPAGDMIGDFGMGVADDASSIGNYSVGDESAAFAQPPENWIPGMNLKDQNPYTKGVSVKQIQRARKEDGSYKPVSNKLGNKDNDAFSVGAERSYADTANISIDTANLEHIAEQLISSDELMRILAKRLGIAEEQVVPAEQMDSVFSVSQVSKDKGNRKNNVYLDADGRAATAPLGAPRDDFLDETFEPEIDSDDDMWSDDENEAGDFDEDDVGDMPTSHKEASKSRRDKFKEEKGDDSQSVPNSVPFLPLAAKGISTKTNGDDATSYRWRKLPRPEIKSNFFQAAGVTRTLGPTKDSANTLNKPIYLMPISPVDACQYNPENFAIDIESIFIPDARKDAERAIATLERNIKREQDLAKNMPTDDLLLFGETKENTTVDNYIASQYKEDKSFFADPKEKAIDQAILAAKSNNIAQMEDALEEDIPINIGDQFGNSLLLLASQQGSKRMCKFLLRRGANINQQNTTGNTVLHYAYAYSQVDLAEYLKRKGADDSIINVDGLTCYEGLSNDNLNSGDTLDSIERDD